MSAALLVRGIYPLLNEGTVPFSEFPAYAKSLADLGVTVIQLRIKDADDSVRYAVQGQVLAALGAWRGLVVIDDRADLARMALAQRPDGGARIGLHLGQHDLPPAAARAIVGPDVIIGLSTHNADDVARSAHEPIDYIGFGPIFATTTKMNPDPTVGLAALAATVRNSAAPVVAIGGITHASLAPIHATGAAAAATVTLLWPEPANRPPEAAFITRARTAMEMFA